MESSTVEAGAPAAAVPDDRCRPPPQASGALLDEAEAAAAPYPCGYCGAFHGSETGYCAACSRSWLKPEIAARAARFQRRAYLALVTLLMSYFETNDKAVLSVFCGSIGLVVFFWFLTKSVATAALEWIAPLVVLFLAAVYMIPTMRRMVVLIEDVDEISALFERTWREHENDEKKGPAPAKLAGALSQPTADLRQLYVLARARVGGFEVDVVECLARAGRTPAEPSRETRGPQLKGLLRAREKIAMDYGGDASHLRDILRASIVCETVEDVRTLGDELAALETAGTVRVVQVKNRFVGVPTPSGYRDVNVSVIYHGLLCEIQIHLEPILAIADQQHVAYEAARELDLMGALEKPTEATHETSSRPLRWGYVAARLLPAVLSAVIGWLYVDAFVLKGANSLVTRADLLPTRGFSSPYVVLRLYGLALAAPYVANTFLLLRAAGCFGERARCQRREKTRVALLYERYFGYEGTYFVWKVFWFQMFEVVLQAYGKVPLFLTYMNPFEGLKRGRDEIPVGDSARNLSKSGSGLHVFVVVFFCALLFNVLYPTFLLRSRDVRYQRDFSFVADTVLDLVYACVPFVFLALGVRSQQMIIPHDPLEYTSNLLPMLHTHFVISTLEAAADESRALRKVAPRPPEADLDEKSAEPSPSSTVKYGTRPGEALYGALVGSCLVLWVLAFFAVSFKNQLIFAAAFVLASLLLPLAARHAGRPPFSVWEPAVLCSGFYLLFCLSSKFQSHILMNVALAFHGALVLFAAPDEASRGLPDTRAAAATKAHRLPIWGSIAYFCMTGGFLAAVVAVYTLGGTLVSTCMPCECTQDGILSSCEVFRHAESLRMTRGLNAPPFADYLDLADKGIKEIKPGSFLGLSSVKELSLEGNKIKVLKAQTFEGLASCKVLTLTDNPLREISPGAFRGLGELKALHLAGYGFTSLRSGTFDGLGALETLDLSRNSLTRIEVDTFRGLGRLTWLSLFRNSLRHFDGAFRDLGRLSRLDLSENAVVHLNASSFSGLTSLSHIDLSDNPVQSVGCGTLNVSGADLTVRWLEECNEEDFDGETVVAPAGTTYWGFGKGRCKSDLNKLAGCTKSPGDCWTLCQNNIGSGIVAVDWTENGECTCQDECRYMSDVGWCSNNTHVITSSGTAVLPDLGAEECPTAAPTLAPTVALTSAGSCYDLSFPLLLTCDVDFSTCMNGVDYLTAFRYWYQPGYVGYSGCCHCKGSCDHTLETNTDCDDHYHDVPEEAFTCDICQGRIVKAGDTAGHHCIDGNGTIIGDSMDKIGSYSFDSITWEYDFILILTKNTEAECLQDDPSNVWQPYTCEHKAGFWANSTEIREAGLHEGDLMCPSLQEFWMNQTDCCLSEEKEDVNTDAAFCAEYEHVQAGLRPCSYYCEPNKCQLVGETILTQGDEILSVTTGGGYEYTFSGSYEARYRYLNRGDYDGTWNDAQRLCERMGASIVAINSEEESQVINTIVGYDTDIWIGYRAAASSSTWDWASGETSDFTVWRAGEPQAEAEAVPRCAFLTTDDQTRSYTTREWREADCNDATMTKEGRKPLLCELGTGTAEWPTPAPTAVRGGACFNTTTMSFSCGVDESTCTNQGGHITWMAPGYVTGGCCICKEDCDHALETGTDCEGQYAD